jgi:hypothetical protein
MISRVRQLAPRVHLPLRQLALCLDCDECFEIGPEPVQGRPGPGLIWARDSDRCPDL